MAKVKTKKQVVAQTKEPRFQGDEAYTSYEAGVPPPDPFTDFIDAYSAHVWVYACVRAIAVNCAGVRILPYVQQKTADGVSWVENTKHELYKLLDFPNPYMSGYNLRQYTVASRKLMGNAYWYLEKFGGTVAKEIWPLIPDMVRPVASKEKLVDHYIYYVNGTPTRLEYDEVIHFKCMNPASFIYGQGDLAAAKTTVITDIFAQVWNKSFFGNAARPDSVLQTENSLEPDVRKRIIKSWESMHKGPNKQGKTAILEAGLKYARVSESTKDMDFVNLRKDMRTEILAAFGVPPSVVGVLEFANYSNMEQQFKSFWTNTLLPELKDIEETLTIRGQQISFDFKSIFQADLSKVQALQPDMKMLAETTKTWVDSGIPINQVIDAMDLPFEHVEGGDEPRQLTSTGFGQPTPPETPPSKQIKRIAPEIREAEWKVFDSFFREHEGSFKATMRGFFNAQKRRVVSSLKKHEQPFLNQVKGVSESVRIIFDIDAETESLKKSAGRKVKGTYFDFAVRQAGKLGIDFSLSDPIALAWIEQKVSKLARDVNRYTLESITGEVADAIQEAIAVGFSEGETIASIVDRIEEVYSFAVEGRAERIARTEVVSASNAGNFEALKQAGAESKEWLSSHDDKVRDTHLAMDQDAPIPLTQPFISPSGATLMFPGDPNAPASEIINCRCVVTGVRRND